MSKSTMAQMIGLTREGVHKAIKDLKDKEYIIGSEKSLKVSSYITRKFESVTSVNKGSKLSSLDDVNSIDDYSKLSLHNKESNKNNLKDKGEEDYKEDFPSEKSSYHLLPTRTIIDNSELLYLTIKHIYQLNSHMSQSEINSIISNAIYWLRSKGKTNLKKDQVLFLEEWVKRNSGRTLFLKNGEKDLSDHQVMEFAELQVMMGEISEIDEEESYLEKLRKRQDKDHM